MKIESHEKKAFIYVSLIFLFLSFILYLNEPSLSGNKLGFVSSSQNIDLKDIAGRVETDRKISINDAYWYELIDVPGIGETLASRIVEYRDVNGKFKDITSLLNVEGIGPKKLEKIKGRLKL